MKMLHKTTGRGETIARGMRELTTFFSAITQQDADPETPAGDGVPGGGIALPAGAVPLARTLAQTREAWLPELLQIAGPALGQEQRRSLEAEIQSGDRELGPASELHAATES